MYSIAMVSGLVNNNVCSHHLYSHNGLFMCTAEATWGDWSSWSRCSASCGGGRRSRRRQCQNGNTCVGRMTEYTDCGTESCPDCELQSHKKDCTLISSSISLLYFSLIFLTTLLAFPVFHFLPLSFSLSLYFIHSSQHSCQLG